jgi:hypothetical protein
VINRFRPHVLVLPEDDANRQLANGFILHSSITSQVQILPIAGGWIKVLDCFRTEHVTAMSTNQNRRMVLLIDFDEDPNRLTNAQACIPEHLKERVFILGVWSEPEALKAARSYEKIGLELAKDCHEGTATSWDHALLRHNAGEVERLRRVREILFQ